MFDDDNDQYGFWSDEPTRALDRIGARRKPAGPAPTAPTRRQRPIDPQVGRRQHGDTQQIPVVANTESTPRSGGAAGLRRGIGHVDPLIRRMAALAIVVAMCVPVAMTLRSGDGRSSLQPDTSTVSVGQTVAATDPAAATEVATDPAVTEAAVVQAVATEVAVTETAAPATEAPVVDAALSNVVAATPVAAPPAIEAVATASTELVCAKEYEVVAGDYWILIAKKVSVSLDDVLTANNATTETAIYPGRTVCLPSNASTPTTAAPATAAAPATTPATTAKPATTAPATTVKAPTTTVKTTSTSTPAAPAPKASYSKAEVEAIIRQVWPDDLEVEAVRIATRESNLMPGVRNYCCFGLFQIYFNVHKTWLGQMGVTSADQLYNPLTNAYVAYAMYLKAGGWGPWRL